MPAPTQSPSTDYARALRRAPELFPAATRFQELCTLLEDAEARRAAATEDAAEDGEGIEAALAQAIVAAQDDLDQSIDALVLLARHLDAEAQAAQARLKAISAPYKTRLERINGWRETLDRTAIALVERGILPPLATGVHHQLRVTESTQLSCDIVDSEAVPDRFKKFDKTPIDRRAVIAAHRKHGPIDGTRVYRRTVVKYADLDATRAEARASAIADAQ